MKSMPKKKKAPMDGERSEMKAMARKMMAMVNMNSPKKKKKRKGKR